jgi:hypothetical protein
VVSLAALTPSQSAHAELSAADLAASDSHVREARRLLQRGRAADACAEYERAHRDYPRSTVLLELADCYRAAGYPGSADDALGRAQALAATENVAGVRSTAETRSNELQGRLARVRVIVSPPLEPSELEVTLDSRPIVVGGNTVHVVDPALLTVKTHVLTVRARGFAAKRWEFELASGEEKTVRVADLAPLSGKTTPRAGLADLRLDRASDAPVGRVTDDTQVSLAAGTTIGVYRTLAGVDPPLVVGTGGYAVFTGRVSVSSGRWSVFARELAAYAFATPGLDAGPLALSAPEIGGGYRLPLGKLALNLSPSFIPPVVPETTTDRLFLARSLGFLANSPAFAARQLQFSLAAVLEVPIGGPFMGIVGVIPQLNHVPDDGGTTYFVAVQITRVAANLSKTVSLVAGNNYVRVIGQPGGTLDFLQGTVGAAYAPDQTLQFSLGVTRTLLQPHSNLTPWLFELGASVSF